MITTKEIESLGWKHKATAKNGGSKLFELNSFTLFSHADNFIHKNKEQCTLSVIHWNALDYKNVKSVIYEGDISTLQDLIDLMVRFNVDVQLTRDTKIEEIVK